MHIQLTVISNIKTLKNPHAMNTRLQHMSALLTQLISIKVQMQTSCRLITR